MRLRFLVIALAVVLMGSGPCSTKDCAKLAEAVKLACDNQSLESTACQLATKAYNDYCVITDPTPEPIPTPTPEPTPLPTPTPEPLPTPTPTPTPTPEPTPTPMPEIPKCLAGTCPLENRYINAGTFDKHYVNSTERCRNRVYCEKATGIEGVTDCALGVEGTGQREICELEHSPGCLKWYYRDASNNWVRCGVEQHPLASCDHYDRYIDWQGPYTGKCETRPDGYPIAGNMTIPHGKTGFRACDTSGWVCSKALELDR